MRSPPAQPNGTIKISFIGFGEVGQTLSRGFLAGDAAADGRMTIGAFDILFGSERGQGLHDQAQEIGVSAVLSTAAAIADADIVISAVTADQAETVATQSAAFLQPGQVYLDVNSAAPSTKRRAAQAVEASGADYVEGAVMAPVLKSGLRVPILAGGPRADATAERLNAFGMNLTPVATEHGRASAMKLCRSIVIKGLETLMVDCAAASGCWGVQDEVFASLSGTFPSIDWPTLAKDMRERVETHGVRRAAEMREAAEMLAMLELDPSLALAIADAQERTAKLSSKN